MKESIHYLNQEERQNTRQMYECIFPEDSKAFVDYYYQWKTKDNGIIVMEDESGYEVMMHLNPYQLCVNGIHVEAPYIVAVATREDCRRKGKMQQVMKQALQDLQKAHCPFTFLLPANPDYYYGQGFVFASELKAAEVQKVSDESGFSVKSLEGKRLNQVVETANQILEEQYHVYVHRDAYYYKRLMEEAAGENGGVLLVQKEECIIGILAYGKGEQAEIKEFLLISEYEGKKEAICNQIFGQNSWNEETMQMMFRITDLQSLDEMLKGEPEAWIVQVKDSFVEENNGCWKIEWNQQGGSIIRLNTELTKEMQKREIAIMDIARLTEKIVEKWKVFIQEWV